MPNTNVHTFRCVKASCPGTVTFEHPVAIDKLRQGGLEWACSVCHQLQHIELPPQQPPKGFRDLIA